MPEYPLKLRVAEWPTDAEHFAWPHVQKCIDKMDANIYNPWRRAIIEELGDTSCDCPGCGRIPGLLFWYSVSSPRHHWEHGTGRAGFLTLCPDCKQQIDFHVDEILTEIEQENFKQP